MGMLLPHSIQHTDNKPSPDICIARPMPSLPLEEHRASRLAFGLLFFCACASAKMNPSCEGRTSDQPGVTRWLEELQHGILNAWQHPVCSADCNQGWCGRVSTRQLAARELCDALRRAALALTVDDAMVSPNLDPCRKHPIQRTLKSITKKPHG